MSEPLKTVPSDRTSIIYDGHCPFCTAYITLLQLREATGPVDVIDGRTRPDVVAELNHLKIDIDQGMVVYFRDQIYYGGDALHILSLLSTKSRIWNRTLAVIFAKKSLARLLYPVLCFGRNATLRLMGRPFINRP
jgi:predicted DCC family thiol-disulfide oxidoreductase YuxK